MQRQFSRSTAITLSFLAVGLSALTTTGFERVALARSRPLYRGAIAQQRILFVDPRGTDRPTAGDSTWNPFASISYALQYARAGTVIQLAPGRYDRERFPLKLPRGVVLRGDETQQGRGFEIIGGGFDLSRFFGRQNATIVAGDRSTILGVTVINPNERGTGIWIENVNATVRNSTFVNNNRDGIAIVGTANPRIENNHFENNRGNGLFIGNQGGGEVRENVFRRTGYGIAVANQATPLIIQNSIVNNRSGIVVTHSASPRIVWNRIEDNFQYGIVAVDKARPSLDNNTLIGNGNNDRVLAGVPQGNPPTPREPNGVLVESPSNTQFFCMKSGGVFTTVARQGVNTMPKIVMRWTEPIGEFTPERICQIVTQRLNSMIADNGGNFDGLKIVSRGLNDSVNPALCLVSNLQSDCTQQNLIFTPDIGNVTLINQLVRTIGDNLNLLNIISQPDGSFVSQSSEGETYIDLQHLDKPWERDPGLWFMEY